jgi:hypothetical protein
MFSAAERRIASTLCRLEWGWTESNTLPGIDGDLKTRWRRIDFTLAGAFVAVVIHSSVGVKPTVP